MQNSLSAIIVSGMAFIVLSPVAIVANSLILVAIWKGRPERTWFHIFVGGLALFDFCTGLLVQPFLGGVLCFSLSIQVHLQIKKTAMVIIGIGFLRASFFGAAVLLLVTLFIVH